MEVAGQIVSRFRGAGGPAAVKRLLVSIRSQQSIPMYVSFAILECFRIVLTNYLLVDLLIGAGLDGGVAARHEYWFSRSVDQTLQTHYLPDSGAIAFSRDTNASPSRSALLPGFSTAANSHSVDVRPDPGCSSQTTPSAPERHSAWRKRG